MPLSKIQLSSSTGRRNLVINGAMNVAQRGTSFTSISSNTYTLDRWQLQAAGDGRSTITQSTTVPNNNFLYSMKVDVTTADTSLGATDLQSFTQRIEGNAMYQLGLGTSSAKSFTVSFWVRSNKTGTYCVAIRNASGGRSITSEYSISSADTWEHKVITFSGDTTGTYSTNNSEGINLNFVLLAGTNHDGKTADTWEANTAFATDNQVNLFDNTSNEWYVTGVQLEVGSAATEFEHRSFEEELAACQRYYKRYNIGSDTAYSRLVVSTYSDTTSRFYVTMQLPVELRTTPTMAQSSLTLNGQAVTSVANVGGTQAMSFVFNHGGSIATNNQYQVYGASGTGTLEFIAEL
mgnify:CR=1 FL=1|tara:strand:- start:1559 stop:2605 length:1047 start_codon:yes stop_codon:yes gene_type:complete